MSSVRSFTSIAASTRTNTTLTAPAGLANGDILVAGFVAVASSSPAITPPAGFTEVTGSPATFSKPGEVEFKTHVYWKLAAGESGSYLFTHASAGTEAVLIAIQSADATPINPNPVIAVGDGTDGLGNILTVGGLTTANNNSLVLFFGTAWDAAGPSAPPSGTTPTFTEMYDPGGVFYVATGVLATAGATGGKSISTPNGTSQPWSAILVAIENDTAGAAVTGTLEATETGADTAAISGGVALPGIRLTLRDTDTGALAASLTGVIISVRATSQAAAVLASATNETTSAGGVLEFPSSAIGIPGDNVYVTVEKSDNSIVAAYRVAVVDLNA